MAVPEVKAPELKCLVRGARGEERGVGGYVEAEGGQLVAVQGEGEAQGVHEKHLTAVRRHPGTMTHRASLLVNMLEPWLQAHALHTVSISRPRLNWQMSWRPQEKAHSDGRQSHKTTSHGFQGAELALVAGHRRSMPSARPAHRLTQRPRSLLRPAS